MLDNGCPHSLWSTTQAQPHDLHDSVSFGHTLLYISCLQEPPVCVMLNNCLHGPRLYSEENTINTCKCCHCTLKMGVIHMLTSQCFNKPYLLVCSSENMCVMISLREQSSVSSAHWSGGHPFMTISILPLPHHPQTAFHFKQHCWEVSLKTWWTCLHLQIVLVSLTFTPPLFQQLETSSKPNQSKLISWHHGLTVYSYK